jgi:hypothetical protein
MNCRHCNQRKANRARGLCWTCSLNPDVRRLYPGSTHKMARRAEKKDFFGGYKPPCEPTTAAPATPEKLAVLAERAARGESLWHPDDGVGSEPDLS